MFDYIYGIVLYNTKDKMKNSFIMVYFSFKVKYIIK